MMGCLYLCNIFNSRAGLLYVKIFHFHDFHKIDLMEIMEVKDFDIEKASSAVKNIAEIKTAHHLEMLKAAKEMRTILTDEQFKKMQKMMPMQTGKKKPAKRMMKKQ